MLYQKYFIFAGERERISSEQLYILVIPGDVNNFSVEETSCLTTDFLGSRSIPLIFAFFCMSALHVIKKGHWFMHVCTVNLGRMSSLSSCVLSHQKPSNQTILMLTMSLLNGRQSIFYITIISLNMIQLMVVIGFRCELLGMYSMHNC